MTPPRPHSADQFTDSRDFWWNPDFLALMARRWELSSVHRALDAGCGVGHWGRLLLPHLAPDAHLTQLDREPEWVAEVRARADARGLGAHVTALQGSVEALPFPDASFQLVTCQTLLIHLPDPARAIAELCRVLEPGGLLAVAEPSNLTNALLLSSHRFEASVEDVVELVRLQLTCERGKTALGEGNNSLGELVPELFRRAGLTGLRVWQSDQAPVMLAPYEGAEQQAALRETRERAREGKWIWDRLQTRQYFLAGGGEAEAFERLWALASATEQRLIDQLAAGTGWSAGNGAFLLTSGRKAVRPGTIV